MSYPNDQEEEMATISIGGNGTEPLSATVVIEYVDGSTESVSRQHQRFSIEFTGENVSVKET